MKILNFIVSSLKHIFGIHDMTLFLRKKKQKIEKLFYKKKYNAEDIIEILKQNGITSGRPLFIHSAMGNMYNYVGTADELIDKLIEFVGPNGTLCMPAYPVDKFNTQKIFDVRKDKTAAGYLAETFRKRPGVVRSLNKLHSVCAYGKDADYLIKDHYLSDTCFDEKSPYYKAGLLDGYTVSLGLPQWYIGTVEHVCESLLYKKVDFFTKKFDRKLTFEYVDCNGLHSYHTMNSLSSNQNNYERVHNTKLVDKYFSPSKYFRKKLSNIWITGYNMKYTCETLTELGEKGITLYK